MPDPVAEIVEALAVVGLEDLFSASRLPTSAICSCRRSLWSLRALNTVVSSGPKWRAKSSWLSSLKAWSGKTSTAYLVKAALMAARSSAASGLAEIDIADFGGEIGRDSMDGDGQGFLPILCLTVIGPPKARAANGFHDTHSQPFADFAARHGRRAPWPPRSRTRTASGASGARPPSSAPRREEVRDRVAAELVVPVVPDHERETWADPEVRAELKDHFIPVHVDQDSRPDISQRYERWGWPATIIFGPDGTEIVKLRGFYSPKFFIPVLQETIKDPSPVNLRRAGRPRARSHPGDRPDGRAARAILAFMTKAYDPANGGWSKSKLVDGPTLSWFLDRAKAGDAEAAERIKRTLTGMTR